MRERLNERITVRLGSNVYSALESAASFYNRPQSDIIREALCEWLEKKGFLKR